MSRQSRIVTDALRHLSAGDDLDTAWARALASTPCAPAAARLAYTIYLTLVTRPETR